MSRRRKKQQGGYLDGPSHEDGGIPAIISGGEEVELEGGEYIINAQTVDALGVPFLDKLNSTATTYHDGGFEQGQLPGPSQYELGGRIPPGFGPEWQRRHGERSHRRAGPRIRRGRGYGGTGDNSGQGAGRRMGGQIFT